MMIETLDSLAIGANLLSIKNRIKKACLKSGRHVADIRILLATKTVVPEKIRAAIAAGETLIGENKVQELKWKTPLLADLEYENHFIGHLQSNKIKEVLKYVTCIQSVDRLEIAEKLDKRLQFEGRKLDIMVQVNTSFEQSKFGAHPDEVLKLIGQLAKLNTLTIKGLMTIGLFDADHEKVRPSFTLLRKLRDKAMNEGLLSPEASALSMGMSGDLETAIEEGATIIRVGTAIFGKRLYPDSYYWNEGETK